MRHVTPCFTILVVDEGILNGFILQEPLLESICRPIGFVETDTLSLRKEALPVYSLQILVHSFNSDVGRRDGRGASGVEFLAISFY